jgi:osmotically-inducible protein OsmY
MADRDRYDWDRGRDFDRDRDYDRGSERGYQDRGMVSRGTDEVRSWFGDDDARRRRNMDEQRERGRERDYGANSEPARRAHGWAERGQRPDSAWQAGTNYGDQRDFVGRSNDWSGDRPYGQGPYRSDNPSTRWTPEARDYGDEDARRWRYPGDERDERWSGQQFTRNPSYPDPYRSYRGPSGGYRGEWSGMHSGRGPRNYQRSDERIREDVNERLTIDARIDASDIDVRVQSGEVTLTGFVEDGRSRRLAEELVEDLSGVRDVHNELRVHRGHDDERHRTVGEQSRMHEDGSIGSTGNPQRRDDVTTVNVKDGTKR